MLYLSKPLTQPPFGIRLMSRNEALLNGVTCRYSQPERAAIQRKPLAAELTTETADVLTKQQEAA